MPDIVDTLREEATSDCVAYTEFMLQYKKGEDILYCFFEGYEDRTYYTIRIENISKTNSFCDFICGGKDEVIKVHDLIKSNIHYKDVKTGFFIDLDFDNYEVSHSIYQTPFYSIENFYCTKEAFEKVILAEFKMKRTDKDFNKCVENYLSLQEKFCSETLLFNAWLSCQADIRNSTQSSTRLKIDTKVKAVFDKIVNPDLTSIKSFEEIKEKNKLEQIFEKAPKVQDEDLHTKQQKFETINPIMFFRGKFMLRFLESYLCRLQSIFGLKSSPFENKYSCSLRVEYNTLCSNLSQYANTPNCLKEYILRISS